MSPTGTTWQWRVLLCIGLMLSGCANDSSTDPGGTPPPPPADAAVAPAERVPFDVRLQAYRAIQRALHSFRQHNDKVDFDKRYPPGSFTETVADEVGFIRLLHQRLGIILSNKELDAELKRMQRSTQAPEQLYAIRAALGNDPVKLRHCFAEPILARRRLRQWYEAHEARIQAPLRRRMKQLRQGLTPDNFKRRAGRNYQEITLTAEERPPAMANGRPMMALPKALYEVFSEDLQSPGDISRVVDMPGFYAVYLLQARNGPRYEVALLIRNKLPFDRWVEQELAALDAASN